MKPNDPRAPYRWLDQFRADINNTSLVGHLDSGVPNKDAIAIAESIVFANNGSDLYDIAARLLYKIPVAIPGAWSQPHSNPSVGILFSYLNPQDPWQSIFIEEGHHKVCWDPTQIKKISQQSMMKFEVISIELLDMIKALDIPTSDDLERYNEPDTIHKITLEQLMNIAKIQRAFDAQSSRDILGSTEVWEVFYENL